MNDPRQHINEEPSHDLIDTALGFGVFFGVLLLIGVAATVVQILMR